MERPQWLGSEAGPASPRPFLFPIRHICGCLRTFSASGPPTLRTLPGWRPVPAVPLVGGGPWAGLGARRTSKLACGEGRPCFAGRRLVLPDGGLQLLPGEGSRRTGSGKPAARAAPPSLSGAWTGSGWGNTSSHALMRVQFLVIRCGMLGTEPLSFVRGRRWAQCGPRGRAGTGREGACWGHRGVLELVIAVLGEAHIRGSCLVLLPPSQQEKLPCSVKLLHTLDSEV